MTHDIRIVDLVGLAYCAKCNTLCGEKRCVCYTCSTNYHIGCVLTPSGELSCPENAYIKPLNKNPKHILSFKRMCPYPYEICSYCMIPCEDYLAECDCGHFFHVACITKKTIDGRYYHRCPFKLSLWRRLTSCACP